MLIILDLPNPTLSPNRKNGKHWAVSHADKKNSRDSAYLAAQAASNRTKLKVQPDTIKITFVLPSRRMRDVDNLLSSSKSSIDGICLALGIDDNGFTSWTLKKEYDKGISRMIIEI